MRELAILGCALVCMSGAALAQATAPAPLAVQRPVAPAAEVCADDAARGAFLAGFEGHISSTTAYARTFSEHAEAVADWKSQQLLDRGIWTVQEQGVFARALLEDPHFIGFSERSMGELRVFMERVVAFEEVRQAGDEAGACAQAVTALAAVERMIDSVTAQWAYVHAQLDAEAAAEGVTLD